MAEPLVLRKARVKQVQKVDSMKNRIRFRDLR